MSVDLSLAEVVQRLAVTYRDHPKDNFTFTKVKWSDPSFIGSGEIGSTAFTTRLSFPPESMVLRTECSLCDSQICPHAISLLRFLAENELAEEVERIGFRARSFLTDKLKSSNPPPWKKRLDLLATTLRYQAHVDPTPPTFPAGREAIYILERDYDNPHEDLPQIVVATRPTESARVSNGIGKPRPNAPARSAFRKFTGGVRGLAASSDPIDREIAERVSLTSRISSEVLSRGQVRLSVSTAPAAELLSRLARAGKLYCNLRNEGDDHTFRLGWLADEPFDLKFQISADIPDYLTLGVCAVGPSLTVSQQELKELQPTFFIDQQNRLGFFRNKASVDLVDIGAASRPINVPRLEAQALIEQVLNLPVGLGIEFMGCEEIRPPTITAAPRPRLHIRAPEARSDQLDLSLDFDYDGVHVPSTRYIAEFFDKTRSAIVKVNPAFHKECLSLLRRLGVKEQFDYAESRLKIAKSRLPALVSELIAHEWHVEAQGKLYRNGSRFQINIQTGIDWFELQGKAHFDDASIDLPKLLHALRAGEQTVVLDDGSVGVIPQDWIKRFEGVARLADGQNGSAAFSRSQVGLLDALLAEQGDIQVDEKFAAARQALRGFDGVHPQEPPAGFVGELRPYQKLAQGWFDYLRNLGFGGCLADDMGLGKTIQVLAMLEKRREQGTGPSLIVVPRSLIFNWISEAHAFTPKIRILDQSHSQRQKGTEHLGDFDLVLTTYGTLRRDAAFLRDFEFDYIILDEAQAIKNASTEAAKATRLLRSRHKLALSGTPIENHLGELWSLFDFLNPGMLGRVGQFVDFAPDAGDDQRKLIAAAVRPFILRRTKKQVAPELPDRIEQTVIVELDAVQRKAYDELREYYRNSLMSKIETDGIGKSQIVILEALLRLRQAACHPGLIDKARIDEPSAKLDELLQRLSSAVESDERVLVFSQFTSLLTIVKRRMQRENIPYLYLDGKTKDRQSLVEEFQSGAGPSIFLISLKAGGVGLNLTAARTVILLDPWWNPAVEAQAIDRTHRIGQRQTVFATRLISADTVEQKVLELQAKKKGLADAIISADNAGISSLSREDLEQLLT